MSSVQHVDCSYISDASADDKLGDKEVMINQTIETKETSPKVTLFARDVSGDVKIQKTQHTNNLGQIGERKHHRKKTSSLNSRSQSSERIKKTRQVKKKVLLPQFKSLMDPETGKAKGDA